MIPEAPSTKPNSLSIAFLLLLSVIFLFCMSQESHAQDKAVDAVNTQKLKVLILDGMDVSAHNWAAKTIALKEILAVDPRFEVEVSQDPEVLASPTLQNFDAILMNYYSPKEDYPGTAAKANLVKYLKDDGKGLFILHFACGNFADWPEFNNIAGLVFTPEGRPGYHDNYGLFDVKITDPDHQITNGLPPVLKAQDECYYCLGGATRDYHILATAFSQKVKSDQPMAFTVNYGKGRVFHTPLGHDVRSIKMPDVAELIRRGLIWAAGQK